MHLSAVATTFPQSVTDMFYELTHNGRDHSWIDTKCHLCFVDFASIDSDLSFAIVYRSNVMWVWLYILIIQPPTYDVAL